MIALLNKIEAEMEAEFGFELDMEFVVIPEMYDRAHVGWSL